MNIQDPISDMLTIIRNGQFFNKEFVEIYFSNFKLNILKIFLNEGFIKKYEIFEINNYIKKLKIFLKYYKKKAVINEIFKISKPSIRIYKKFKNIPKFKSELGIYIISTSKGLLTDKKCKNLRLGGELLLYIS